MKKLLASAALAAALSVGGLAHATVYNLNVDGCSSGCGLSSYGTVTVTGQGTSALSFDVELAANVFFNMAGGPEEAFSIVGDPTISIAGLPAQFGNNGSQAAGSHHESAFGNFDYIVSYLGPPNNNGGLPGTGIQSLLFTVTGPGALNLDFNSVGGHDIFFTVDVATKFPGSATVLTGNVGATIGDEGGGVPEPATWAMMLVGFGGMGALLRRRRHARAFA